MLIITTLNSLVNYIHGYFPSVYLLACSARRFEDSSDCLQAFGESIRRIFYQFPVLFEKNDFTIYIYKTRQGAQGLLVELSNNPDVSFTIYIAVDNGRVTPMLGLTSDGFQMDRVQSGLRCYAFDIMVRAGIATVLKFGRYSLMRNNCRDYSILACQSLGINMSEWVGCCSSTHNTPSEEEVKSFKERLKVYKERARNDLESSMRIIETDDESDESQPDLDTSGWYHGSHDDTVDV